MEFEKFIKIRREKFGAVVFDTLREKVFVANETGSEILKLLEEKTAIEDILITLTGEFEGNSPLVERDLTDFIKELEEKDLVIK